MLLPGQLIVLVNWFAYVPTCTSAIVWVSLTSLNRIIILGQFLPFYPLQGSIFFFQKKLKILKILPFCTSAPKIMITWCLVGKLWFGTDNSKDRLKDGKSEIWRSMLHPKITLFDFHNFLIVICVWYEFSQRGNFVNILANLEVFRPMQRCSEKLMFWISTLNFWKIPLTELIF